MDELQKNSSHFICPSTRKFFREWRAIEKHSLGDFIHGYIYGRWTYTYIGVAKGSHPLTKILGPLFSFVSLLFPKPKVDVDNRPDENKQGLQP